MTRNMLELVPISITDAKAVVAKWHRHNNPPLGGLFAVSCRNGGSTDICGVAIVGRPVARKFQDGFTCEVTRLATNGERNACSLLYGACCRAAAAIGFRRIFTYTFQEEPGSSLKASGWTMAAELAASPSWSSPSRLRIQTDLFGNETRPSGPKVRWIKTLQSIAHRA